jgi:hypothetical protein
MLGSRLRRLGWISFALMWLPFTAIFIGMIRLPSGSYDWVELPLITRIGLMGTGIFFVITMLTMVRSPLISWASNRSLQTKGLQAQATILEIRDTGTTINQSPLVHLKLQVEPGDRPGFQADTELVINRLQVPQLQPGAKVPVRYDPESHAVALDTN